MNHGTFRLVGLDERGGPQRSERGERLVCRIEGGGKLAIWGSEKSGANIELVQEAGFPCTVCCQWREPAPWAIEKFGHTHWAPESGSLKIVETAKP